MKLYSEQIKKLIAKYKWNSLFFMYFKRFAVIIIIPVMLLNTIIYLLYSKNTANYIENSVKKDFLVQTNAINTSLSETISAVETIIIDKWVQQFVYASVLEHDNKYVHDAILNANVLMANLIKTSKTIGSVHIYSAINRYVASTKESNYIENLPLMDIVAVMPENGVSSYKCVADEAEPGVIHILRSVYTNKSLRYIVIITINQDVVIQNSKSDYMSELFLTYEGEKIYDFERTCTQEHRESIIKSAKTQNDTLISNVLGDNDVVLGTPLEINNLNVIAAYSMEGFASSVASVLSILLLCIFLAILIPVFLSIYLSLQYYKSISNIVIQLHEDLITPNGISAPDELSFISSKITKMTDKIKDMELSLTDRLVALKKSQISVLQSQINPHFIFNTLNSINLYVINKLGGVYEPSIMISNLSDILTEIMTPQKYITTVANEIEYVKKYLTIEQIRQINSFDVVWEVDDSLKDCKTVKMILQPVIENALVHGIYEIEDGRRGELKISVYQRDKDIVFCITDNGKGFDTRQLIRLKENLAMQHIPDSKHIGLANIHIRIRTVYGDGYGCEIESVPGCTRVYISIPKNYSAEEL